MSYILKDNVTLSTAAFCLWDIPAHEKLEHCSKLGFKNIQIALSTIKMLNSFKANVKNLPQIKDFNDVSIYAPWCGIKYGHNKKTLQVIECLKSIEEYIPVSRYVFNYDCILDIDVLYNSGLNITIRNPVKPDSWKNFSSTINERNLPCVFDLNKAARNNYPFDSMINEVQSL